MSRRALYLACLLVICEVPFSCSGPVRLTALDDRVNFVRHCDECATGNRTARDEGEEVEEVSMIDDPEEDPTDEDGSGDEEDDMGEEGELFEGDIQLGEEYILSPTNTSGAGNHSKNLVLKDGLTWPNKQVFYNFSTEFSPEQMKVVDDAIQDMHNVSCVRFLRRKNESTYLYFRNKKKACSAPVGWNPARGRIDVSLGGRNCLARRGTVQHELLHALGFWHEHSRTDRDFNIVIQWDNILEGREKNFKSRMANESTTLGIPYDFNSVMHYRNNSFSRDKKRKPTILPRNSNLQVQMGQRIRISESDIAKLNRLYRCDKHKYNMGNTIVGAMHWDAYRETFFNEKPIYFNKLPEPEPLEFEENKYKKT